MYNSLSWQRFAGALPPRPAGPTSLVRAWVDGWVVSRATADPVAEPWGWSIAVGVPDQVTRHVVPSGNEQIVRALAEAVAVPGQCLKVSLPDVAVTVDRLGAAQEMVGAWLGATGTGWSPALPGVLMALPLMCASAPAAPAGYRQRTWVRADVVHTLVTTAGGAFAARGQLGLCGRIAVADQILTDPAHRRRGLGSLVMRTLQAAGYRLGARTGLLDATLAGRRLYESLGWQACCAMATLTRGGSSGTCGGGWPVREPAAAVRAGLRTASAGREPVD
ncbi:GNAT family N-acetyltransferase [Streptomyces sp. NPDC127020]|uniref:GNAT family N-acetyltransferase n=1 Tax=Streptomyces sp. NPDC127020 TaxID=3347109 RepID=UPI003659F13C